MIAIQGSYDGWVVLLSFAIALFTSYSALNLSYKISHAKGKARLGWLIVSGAVMGSGIWTMHFIGMMAFHLEIEVRYHGPTTAISIIAGIIASLMAFYVTMAERITKRKLLAGSLFMGAGIVTMHYTGMASMASPALKIGYDPVLWGVSAVIAVIVSYAALYLLTRFREDSGAWWLKLAAALLMAVAVSGMHYTGMEATMFWCAEPELLSELQRHDIDRELLIAISCMMIAIVGVTWVALHWDRLALRRMAYSDPLTGLPNRHAMNQIVDDNLMRYKENAVLFMDLDQFKLINDTLGHDFGDLLVQEVGSRLNQFTGRTCSIFRLGGDEFLMVVNDRRRHDVEALAVRILDELRRPYWLQGHELHVTGSVGISYAPLHGTSRTELLKAADTAMYYAKGLGKNQFCTYNEEMDRKLARRMEIEKGLRTALMQGELTTHYQPRWNTATNRPIGFEALLRWTHPKLGSLSPDEFIPIAEDTGLIVPITKWVLEQACLDCRDWNVTEEVPLGVSVNLSINVFEGRSLNEMVVGALERSGLNPELLELEITEEIGIRCAEEAIEQLMPLQQSGVRVTMDNFGSGYSFLGSIDKIPFQTLKIDKLYMQNYESHSKRAIVNTLITLANQLNIGLVAEGVETERQLEFLTQAGCSLMQGYYFQKPMPREEVAAWLHSLTG